jgi:hypothetical protein
MPMIPLDMELIKNMEIIENVRLKYMRIVFKLLALKALNALFSK